MQIVADLTAAQREKAKKPFLKFQQKEEASPQQDVDIPGMIYLGNRSASEAEVDRFRWAALAVHGEAQVDRSASLGV